MSVEPALVDSLAARVRLIAESPHARQPKREITHDVTVIGSGDGCDLILASSSVDAAHAAIVRLANTAYLCDLGAPGGTIVNGRHIRWARLTHGDAVELGRFSFRVSLEEPGALATIEQPVFSLRNEQCIGVVANIDPVLIVGSDAGCDVVLPEGSVEPRHCLLAWTQNGPIVRDLTGRRDTRHNGRGVHTGRLLGGDSIGAGPYELIFEISTQPAAANGFAQNVSAGVVELVGDGDPSWLVSGSLPPTDLPQLDALWPTMVLGSTNEAPQAEATPDIWDEHAETAPAGSGREGSHEAPPASVQEQRERKPASLADTLTEEERQSLEARTPSPIGGPSSSTGQRPAAPPRDRATGAAAKEVLKIVSRKLKEAETALTQRGKKLEQTAAVQRQRVSAAQRALDERARKLWAELRQECRRIKVLQDQLHVEREDWQKPQGGVTAGSPVLVLEQAEDHSPDPETILAEPLAQSSHDDPEPTGDTEQGKQQETPDRKPTSDRKPTPDQQATLDHRPTLEAQASELAEFVRAGREQIEADEQKLKLIRMEVERLQAAVARTHERYRDRLSECDSRSRTLNETREKVRREREVLESRLSKLDAKDRMLRVRAEEVACFQREVDREKDRLHRAEEEFAERQRELRTALEDERARLRDRQDQLRRRAAALAEAAREQRRTIQTGISEECAILQQREAELRARRAAVEEIGQAELAKTTTELEQVLSVRLADIEAEVQTRQTELEARMESLLPAGRIEPGESVPAAPAPDYTPLRETIAELEALIREGATAGVTEDGRLVSWMKELDGLREAASSAVRADARHACAPGEKDETSPRQTEAPSARLPVSKTPGQISEDKTSYRDGA